MLQAVFKAPHSIVLYVSLGKANNINIPWVSKFLLRSAPGVGGRSAVGHAPLNFDERAVIALGGYNL